MNESERRKRKLPSSVGVYWIRETHKHIHTQREIMHTCIETAFFSNRHTEQAKKAFTFVRSEGKANDIINISFFHPCLVLCNAIAVATAVCCLQSKARYCCCSYHCQSVLFRMLSTHIRYAKLYLPCVLFLLSVSIILLPALCRSSLSHSIFYSLFLPNKLIELQINGNSHLYILLL